MRPLDLTVAQRRRKRGCNVEVLREELRALLDNALEECEEYGWECGRAEAETGESCIYNCHYEKSFELAEAVVDLLRRMGCL